MAKAETVKKSKKQKNLLWIFFITLMSIASVILLVVALSGAGKEMLVKSEITKHLKNRYGEDFIVGDVKLNGVGLGVKGIWQGKAHPVNNKDLTFYISKSDSTGKITDSYVSTVWSNIETMKSASGVRKIIPSVKLIKVRVGVDSDFSKNPLEMYSVVRERNQDKLAYTLVVITNENTNNVADKLFKSIRYLNASGLQKIDLLYAEQSGDRKMYGRSCSTDALSSIEDINKCISDKVVIDQEDI